MAESVSGSSFPMQYDKGKTPVATPATEKQGAVLALPQQPRGAVTAQRPGPMIVPSIETSDEEQLRGSVRMSMRRTPASTLLGTPASERNDTMSHFNLPQNPRAARASREGTPASQRPSSTIIPYDGFDEQEGEELPTSTRMSINMRRTPTANTTGQNESHRWSHYSQKSLGDDLFGTPGMEPESVPRPSGVSGRRTIDSRTGFAPYYSERNGDLPEHYDDGDHYTRPHRRSTRRPTVGSQNPNAPFSRYDFDSPSATFTYGNNYGYPDGRPHAGGDGSRGGYRGNGRPPSTHEVFRLPWLMWMNSNAKNHFVAFIGEFVGTAMFLFFAFAGTQVANIGSKDAANSTTNADTGFSPEVLLYISLVFAFSLMVNVWVFFRISGGLFNPAVTFAFFISKSMPTTRALITMTAQISGSIFSSYIVSVLFPTPLKVRTTLSTGTSLARGVFIEALLTAELVFTIFMLAKEKHKATFIAPVGIGLALFIAELVGVFYTGGSLNPARSFGPCVVTGIFDAEHWIYWLGPAIGAIIAVLFYQFIKILEYEMANPGQDHDGATGHAHKEKEFEKEKKSWMNRARWYQDFDAGADVENGTPSKVR